MTEHQMIKKCRMAPHDRGSEAGFSLIELMVAMVIFILITGSIYGLLQFGTYDRNRASRRADVMKNARAAIHLIGRDALNAGLGYHQNGGIVADNSATSVLGIPSDPNSDRDALTSVIVGNDIFTNDLLNDPTKKTDVIAFAFRDLNFNNGNAVKINPPVVGGGPANARITSKSGPIYRNSDPSNPLLIDANNRHDLYIVEGDSSQVAVMASTIVNSTTIDFAPGDPLGLNQPMNGTGTGRSMLKGCAVGETEGCTTFSNATLKKFNWISYKIRQDGTLIRTTYGNNYGQSAANQIQEQPLAYNVRNMQLMYVLRDGSVTDDPVSGPDGVLGTADDTPENVNLVAQVTVTIEVQAVENDEQLEQAQVIKLTSTFGVRNPQYDAG